MMLAYQPIRSLATINMLFYQGAAAAERVFSIIDTKVTIKEQKNLQNLKIDRVNIESVDIHISSLTSTITSLTSEKADYEQLKTDLEAL